MESILVYGGLYATWLLLPLVPTVLIYLVFPKQNRLVANGKFAGFNIRAGGAAGAYLVILAGVTQFIIPRMDVRIEAFEKAQAQARDDQKAREATEHADKIARENREDSDLWTVEIPDIELKKENGDRYPEDRVTVRPTTYKFDEYGGTIVLQRVRGTFPNIVIEAKGFSEPYILPLRTWYEQKTKDPALPKMDIETSKRLIKVKEKISIKEASAGGAARPVQSARGDREETLDRPR